LYAPEGGRYVLWQSKMTPEFGLVGRLVLSGKIANSAKEARFIVQDHHAGIKGPRGNTKDRIGMPFASAFELGGEMDISSFINALERDDDGQVTVFVEYFSPLELVDVTDESNEEQLDLLFPIWGFAGSDGIGTGGPGLGGGFNGFWSNILSAIFPEVIEDPTDDEAENVDLWGSTSVYLEGVGFDLDIKPPTKGDYLSETREDNPGSVLSVVSHDGNTKSSNAATMRVSKTGVAQAVRTLSFDDSILAVYRSNQLLSSPVSFQESEGEIILEVFARLEQSGGLPTVNEVISAVTDHFKMHHL
jgi:hypothetical protein